MEMRDVSRQLNSLIQLDIDAARAYYQAIAEIPEQDIRQTLSSFCDDHNQHILDLSQIVRDMGETPPAYSPDLKGFFIEKFTAIRSKAGTESALKAMRDNELLTNNAYSEAQNWVLGPVARACVDKNFREEQGHSSYIHQALSNRIWEHPTVRPSEQPFREEHPDQPGI
jgi:competence protein ComEA